MLRLQRDSLWLQNCGKPQFEFVVDNETVAGLMNLERRVDNPFYEPMVARMRQSIFDMFSKCFECKAGYLSCHDWRPRELNKQADAVCNWVLDDRADMDKCDMQFVLSKVQAGHVLQIYSDGGFDGTSGAAAFVVICSENIDGEWQASVCGYRHHVA